jgi:hypothetical protein
MLAHPLFLLWPPYRVHLEITTTPHARHPSLRALACAVSLEALTIAKS